VEHLAQLRMVCDYLPGHHRGLCGSVGYGEMALVRAWLVTWEWDGEHARVDDKIAAVLNPRLSGDSVRKIVELLYVNAGLSIVERLAYARSARNTAYPAEFVGWEGQIVCGSNPFLYARRVEDVRVEVGEDGEGDLQWSEQSREQTERALRVLRGGAVDSRHRGSLT
jgi:hypothetical protein